MGDVLAETPRCATDYPSRSWASEAREMALLSPLNHLKKGRVRYRPPFCCQRRHSACLRSCFVESGEHIGLMAARQNGFALKYAHEVLHRNGEVVIEAVKQYGSALEDVEDILRTDSKMVMWQSGRALVHVCPRPQADLKIVFAAAKQTAVLCRTGSMVRSTVIQATQAWSSNGLQCQEGVDEGCAFIARDGCIATWATRPCTWLRTEAVRLARCASP